MSDYGDYAHWEGYGYDCSGDDSVDSLDSQLTELHRACLSNSVKTVQSLLENGAHADINDHYNDHRWTPLHMACSDRRGAGYVRIAQLLIEWGADYNLQSSGGKTAIHMACDNELWGVFKCLLEYGADINIKDNDGKTALIYLLSSDLERHDSSIEMEMAQLLILNGADLDAQEDDCGATALHYACSSEHAVKLVKLLVDAGASVHSTTERVGATPLHWAFDHLAIDDGALEIAEVLVNGGADLNAKTKSGETVMHKAFGYEEFEKIKWLLENGANSNAEDNQGETPMHYVCRRNSKALMELFIWHGVDLNVRNNDGETPLHLACENQNVDLEIIKLMVENGANVKLKSNNGSTPFHVAAARNHPEVVFWFMSQNPLLLLGLA